ncbi:Zinc finger CCCH domain-containing protein 41 [Vitis vinifera]|uniref:Zinc finger CCCH domain-containing protein 41 n=1 Tax=Vitis vinifera TaxID=29760 RepID=A0A438EFK1_VITVI|nr:Zinc finger CCCH domain-containing protein 41 [Vitis vinifera]
MNQSFSGDSGPVRGRGRDPGSWNQRDLDSAKLILLLKWCKDLFPQVCMQEGGCLMFQTHRMLLGVGLGYFQEIPNGALDSLHSLGLQGTLRPPLSTSLNKSIPRQRCRDFEERGFCLRGDMCPMEHGVNRIVVEDVQSLSQFNLPVSLPSAHLLGTPAGPGPLPSVNAPPSTLMNSKGFQNKSGKPEVAEDELGLNGAFSGSAVGGGAELLCDGSDNGRPVKNTGTTVGSQSTNVSVWGRIGGAKDRLEAKEKIDSVISSSDYLENEGKEDQEALTSVQGTSRQGKRIIVEDIGSKNVDLSSRTQSDAMRNIRKPSQKALRTLFVNGIPQKNNRKEALLSHFRKFGEVIDIYIPLNSERAFVQFSKREEAEAALQAPDAVMGNRFIKLWWANRDSVPDDSISGGNGASVIPHGVTAASVPSHPSAVNRAKDNLQSAAPKVNAVHAIDAPSPTSDHSKPIVYKWSQGSTSFAKETREFRAYEGGTSQEAGNAGSKAE